MSAPPPSPPPPPSARALTASLAPGTRLLALSASGRGKRRTLLELARSVAEREGSCHLLSADPGHPGWGPPTAVSLFRLSAPPDSVGAEPAQPQRVALAAVGTLDPLRHRARYLAACQRLLGQVPAEATVLIDAPSVLRAPQAEAFVAMLVGGLGATWVLGVGDDARLDALLAPLEGRPGLTVFRLPAREGARAPSKAERRRRRTEAWTRYLDGAPLLAIPIGDGRVRGPAPDDGDWTGRAVALLAADGTTLALGEVARLEAPTGAERVNACLFVTAPLNGPGLVAIVDVANAARRDGSELRTVAPRQTPRPRVPPAWTLPSRPEARIPIRWPEAAGQAPWEPRFLNPLTGDPALMLRHARSGRALLLDFGWLEPMPTRLLHAVTDLFVSHGHMDHLQGLVVLLRVLLGPGGSVRLYGPPGLSDHVEALFRAFDFGLIEDEGPELIVHELAGKALRVVSLRVAAPPVVEERGVRSVSEGCLLEEPALTVRAVTLEHRGPVLAFRVEAQRRHVLRHGVPFERDYTLAYVTDVADTPENRAAIVALARGVDLFVCEAAFAEAHAARARETGHLTARACGELARAAGVGRLVPFHFSARYHDAPARIYREVMAVFDRVEPAVEV